MYAPLGLKVNTTIEGDSGTTHTIRTDSKGIISCTCMAWRMMKKPIQNRSCKHIDRAMRRIGVQTIPEIRQEHIRARGGSNFTNAQAAPVKVEDSTPAQSGYWFVNNGASAPFGNERKATQTDDAKHVEFITSFLRDHKRATSADAENAWSAARQISTLEM